MRLDDHFLGHMRQATEVLRSSGPMAATAVIQRALQGPPSGAATQAGARRVGLALPAPPATEVPGRRGAPPAAEGAGKFLAASCTARAGTRAYKLYVPSRHAGRSLPLIVMLHGCKQNPDDFAAGTGMNAFGEKHDCFVVYPAQAQRANGSNCWNWFKAEEQQRDRGEPSIIAQITRDVIGEYHVDPSRVYVAGLSAGGAMAAILGARYPDLYAAIGVHSGLAVGAAHDLPSAFQAMKRGMVETRPRQGRKPMPVIVFHGDRDTTVHPRNGEQALAQCVDEREDGLIVRTGSVPNGRAYTVVVRRSRDGRPMAEQWTVHGAGHAWSGGSPSGSYTDPLGPNASAEMLRFFYSHARSAS